MEAKEWVDGSNMPYRRGRLFIKPASALGNPHAEEAAGEVYKHFGVPGLYPRMKMVEGKPATVARFLPGKSLMRLTPEDVPAVSSWAKANERLLNKNKLLDWVMNIGDRHSGNYLWTPSHGILSIDHGDAFHPLNDAWPYAQREGNFGPYITRGAYIFKGTSLPWAVSPNLSAIHDLGRVVPGMPMGYNADHPIHPDDVKQVLSNTELLHKALDKGTTGLPEEEKAWARRALALRLQHLIKNPPASIHDLNQLTREVRHAAEAL